MWFWNGLPPEAREVTGALFSLGADELLIGGSQQAAGKLRFGASSGLASIPTKAWTYIAFVREGSRVRVHLNGDEHPDIDTNATANVAGKLFVGGHAEGKFQFRRKNRRSGRLSPSATGGRSSASLPRRRAMTNIRDGP
jgi:hypothetical protein